VHTAILWRYWSKRMARRVHAHGKAQVRARFSITGVCDTDENIIVAAVYHTETGALEAREFRQNRDNALRADDWFRSQNVEFIIIESTTNDHLFVVA
jgi:hypothetical protein